MKNEATRSATKLKWGCLRQPSLRQHHETRNTRDDEQRGSRQPKPKTTTVTIPGSFQIAPKQTPLTFSLRRSRCWHCGRCGKPSTPVVRHRPPSEQGQSRSCAARIGCHHRPIRFSEIHAAQYSWLPRRPYSWDLFVERNRCRHAQRRRPRRHSRTRDWFRVPTIPFTPPPLRT